MIFQRKAEDEYESFLRQIRSEAYVEVRLPGVQTSPAAAPAAGAL
jgi:peptidyl-prolyl cis-trans isomerase SurA